MERPTRRRLVVILVRLRSGPLVIRLGLLRFLLAAAQQEIEILLPIIQHQPQPVALLVMLAQTPEKNRLRACQGKLLRYQQEMERFTNIWTKRARNERFSRYWQVMSKRNLEPLLANFS